MEFHSPVVIVRCFKVRNGEANPAPVLLAGSKVPLPTLDEQEGVFVATAQPGRVQVLAESKGAVLKPGFEAWGAQFGVVGKSSDCQSHGRAFESHKQRVFQKGI